MTSLLKKVVLPFNDRSTKGFFEFLNVAGLEVTYQSSNFHYIHIHFDIYKLLSRTTHIELFSFHPSMTRFESSITFVRNVCPVKQ